MDEMDAVVWFDDVLIPWERVFLYRDLEAADRIRGLATAHGMHQTNTKNLAKAESLSRSRSRPAGIANRRFRTFSRR